MKENVELQKLNTFGISAKCEKFKIISTLEEAQAFFKLPVSDPLLILGGGSNILLRNDFKGLVVLNDIRGVEIIEENEDSVTIKANAGEIWHDFVLYCIQKGFAGLENLSLIPGKVGASPMQNIGAYGVEVKEVIESLDAITIADGSLKTFTNSECEFDYRSSVFKTSLQGKYFITSVTFRLSKKPQFKTAYGAIQQQLEKMGVTEDSLNIQAVSDAVIAIRQSKLPDPKKIGNSGSFFKNPVVLESDFLRLKKRYSSMPAYQLPSGMYKLAAGWLIEKAGWKGYRKGDCGVHDKQALVLVNHGQASGNEIYQLSEQIIQSISKKFGIELEREVNIIGSPLS